jgi:hypothetical protein
MPRQSNRRMRRPLAALVDSPWALAERHRLHTRPHALLRRSICAIRRELRGNRHDGSQLHGAKPGPDARSDRAAVRFPVPRVSADARALGITRQGGGERGGPDESAKLESVWVRAK